MKERFPKNPPIAFHPEGAEQEVNYRVENDRVETRTVAPTIGRPGNPGEESVGPSLFALVQRTSRAIEVQAELLRHAIPLLDQRTIVERSSGNTDANGNLDLQLYTVPQGYELTMTRLNLEAGTFTPAVPFANAAAWLAIIQGVQFGLGSILDFGPGSVGGTIFPSIFVDSDSEAIKVRGGQILTLHVVGTAALANTAVVARLQGQLGPI